MKRWPVIKLNILASGPHHADARTRQQQHAHNRRVETRNDEDAAPVARRLCSPLFLFGSPSSRRLVSLVIEQNGPCGGWVGATGLTEGGEFAWVCSVRRAVTVAQRALARVWVHYARNFDLPHSVYARVYTRVFERAGRERWGGRDATHAIQTLATETHAPTIPRTSCLVVAFPPASRSSSRATGGVKCGRVCLCSLPHRSSVRVCQSERRQHESHTVFFRVVLHSVCLCVWVFCVRPRAPLRDTFTLCASNMHTKPVHRIG